MRRKVFCLCVLFAFLFSSLGSAQTAAIINVTTNVPTVNPGGFAEFVIFKSPGPDVTVHFEVGGTAIRGTDYIIIGDQNSIVAPSGTDAALVRIQTLDRSTVEPVKTITLRLLPDAGYTIGLIDPATVLLQNAPLSEPPIRLTLGPLLYRPIDPVVVAPNSMVTANITGVSGSVWVFLDSARIGRAKSIFGNDITYFQISFPAPGPGLHVLTAVATDARGLSRAGSLEFRVADALLTPSSIGSFANATLISTNRIFTVFDSGAGTAAAFLEFAVPAEAGSWNAQLFLDPPSEIADQLFAYTADGTVTTNDLSTPAELIGTLGVSQIQVDVTRWTQPRAGGYIGLKLKVDASATNEIGATASIFNNVRLAFFSPTNDVPLRLEARNLLSVYPSFEPLVFEFETYDPDSRIRKIEIDDTAEMGRDFVNFILAEQSVDLPPGTNFLSIQVANPGPGDHTFSLQVTTSEGSTTHVYPRVYVPSNNAPGALHRWLGTDAGSQSFYVVDASGNAWVWGNNVNGQLGLGFKGGVVSRPAMLAAPPGKKWRQFTSNSSCAVGVTDNGAIYVMGSPPAGLADFVAAQDLSTPSFVSLTSDDLYARRIALTESALWIINGWSMLREPFGPSALRANSMIEMKTGGSRIVALDSSGALYSAEDDTVDFSLLSSTNATMRWKAVSTCATHALALDAEGRLFGWGQNPSGQLPLPPIPALANPTLANFPEGVTGWNMVEAGANVSLAVASDGKLYSWGKEGYTGSTESYAQSKIVPVAIPGGESGWLDLAVGSTFAMALSARGNLYVWGDIPASPVPRHVELPELATGVPNLLSTSGLTATVVTFEPQSIRLGTQLDVDIIVPQSANLTLQSSSNLVTWTTLTNVSATAGKTHVVASPPGGDQVFIRVKP